MGVLDNSKSQEQFNEECYTRQTRSPFLNRRLRSTASVRVATNSSRGSGCGRDKSRSPCRRPRRDAPTHGPCFEGRKSAIIHVDREDHSLLAVTARKKHLRQGTGSVEKMDLPSDLTMKIEGRRVIDCNSIQRRGRKDSGINSWGSGR